MSQLKTFHFWFMILMAAVDGVVGSQGLLSAKAMQVLLMCQGFLTFVNHQMAARWVPAKIEEPTARVIPMDGGK